MQMITTRNTAIVAPPAMLAVSNITRCREAVTKKEKLIVTFLTTQAATSLPLRLCLPLRSRTRFKKMDVKRKKGGGRKREKERKKERKRKRDRRRFVSNSHCNRARYTHSTFNGCIDTAYTRYIETRLLEWNKTIRTTSVREYNERMKNWILT